MKLLIVDDDAIGCQMLATMVEDVADSVKACHNGREALDYLQSGQDLPDLGDCSFGGSSTRIIRGLEDLQSRWPKAGVA